MVLAFQGSLLSGDSPALAGVPVRRRRLDRGAWLDHAPGWLAGADARISLTFRPTGQELSPGGS